MDINKKLVKYQLLGVNTGDEDNELTPVTHHTQYLSINVVSMHDYIIFTCVIIN